MINKAKQTKLKQTKTNQEKPVFCLPFAPVLLTWFFALFLRSFCGQLLPVYCRFFVCHPGQPVNLVTWITGENTHLLTAGSLFAGLLLKSHRRKYSPLTRKPTEHSLHSPEHFLHSSGNILYTYTEHFLHLYRTFFTLITAGTVDFP